MMSPSHHPSPVSAKCHFAEKIIDDEEYDWLSFPYWAEALSLSFAARAAADRKDSAEGLAPASSGACEFVNWLQRRDPPLARLVLRCMPEFIAVRDCIDERCEEQPELRGDRVDGAAGAAAAHLLPPLACDNDGAPAMPPSKPRHQPPRSSSAGDLRQPRNKLAPRVATPTSSPRGGGVGDSETGMWVLVAARGDRREFWYNTRSGRSSYSPPRELRRAASAPVIADRRAPPSSRAAAVTPTPGSSCGSGGAGGSGRATSGDRAARARPQPAGRLPLQCHHQRSPPRAVASPAAAPPPSRLASRQQEHQHHRSPPHPPRKQMRGQDRTPKLPDVAPPRAPRSLFVPLPLPSAPAVPGSQYRAQGYAA